MLRSFDHAGYYETRLILMLVVLGVAGCFAVRKRDFRYLVMFASGAVFQAWMEYSLQRSSLRGANYSLSVFGLTLSPLLRQIFQGCVEGGTLSVMAFWFVDLRGALNGKGPDFRVYLSVCALIVVLATVVGWLSVGQPISSPRPMFTTSRVLMIGAYILGSVLLCWWRGGLRQLGYFYLGLLIYIVLTFEPLHAMAARYIGVRAADGQVVKASFPLQIMIMSLSHVWEVAGGKIHYFAIPFAVGLLRLRGGSHGSNEGIPLPGL